MLDRNIPIGHVFNMTTLATYLKAHGITQAEFAERIGVTQGAVSRLCSRKVGASLETALKISAATGGEVPPASLCDAPHAKGVA